MTEQGAILMHLLTCAVWVTGIVSVGRVAMYVATRMFDRRAATHPQRDAEAAEELEKLAK